MHPPSPDKGAGKQEELGRTVSLLTLGVGIQPVSAGSMQIKKADQGELKMNRIVNDSPCH